MEHQGTSSTQPGVCEDRRFRLNLDDSGASSVEYALLVALIALIIFAAVALVGRGADDLFSSVASGF